MANINIQLPILDAEHKIEIEVKVNGKGKKYRKLAGNLRTCRRLNRPVGWRLQLADRQRRTIFYGSYAAGCI